MAKQLSPDDKGAIYDAWLREGNAYEVARQFNVDEKPVRNVLRERDAPRKSVLHARALERAERDARRALVSIRAKLEAAAEQAADVKELATIAAQVHDNARATTQMRVAHAKLTGEHAAEKHAHTVDTDDVLAGKLARLVAAAGAGNDPR